MTYWDKDTIELVQNLNGKLKIDHSKWHKEKGNKYKRSAELISAGLCQLIISCNEKEAIEPIRILFLNKKEKRLFKSISSLLVFSYAVSS